jgi:hypothetical protein
MFHPSALRTLIFESLTKAQQEATAGRFSDPIFLPDDEVGATVSYFTKDLSATVRQVALSTSKALLFVEKNTFKIMSNPRPSPLTTGPTSPSSSVTTATPPSIQLPSAFPSKTLPMMSRF